MVGRKSRHPGSIRRALSGALPLLVLASMLVHAPAAQAAGGPTISSDKPDYFAGEVVTLTGADWVPGETVVVVVSDEGGGTWSWVSDEQTPDDSDAIVADGAGSFTVSLTLPSWYVPLYTVRATGSASGLAETTFSDAPQITYNNFEGEIAPQGSNNWTNGNISGYKEGDTVRFRLDLDSDPGTLSGNLLIGYTSKPSCRFFTFENPTNVSVDFDRSTDAIDPGTGFSATLLPGPTQDGNDAVATFQLSSSAQRAVRLNFTLHLSDDAASCASGSSQHVEVNDATGDIKDSGKKSLPIPSTAVAPVTDIALTKQAPATGVIGQPISYTLTVTNLDSMTAASGVVVTDTLPTGVSFASGTWTKTNPAGAGTCTNTSQTVTCTIGNLAGGASASITITGTIAADQSLCGTTLTNTASATTTTLQSNTQNDQAQANTTIASCEAAPSIQVTKTPSPSSVDEPGGPVTFTVTVKNTSGPTDPVTITSLNDNVHGDLDGQGTCSVPQLITPGTTYTCTFTATVSGDAGDSETDTVTAAGQDDEQTGVSGEASATVTVTDVKPTIQVDKTATPTTVTTPGGPVTFAVSVKNTSPEPVTLTTLTDDVHGNLDGQGTCDVPQTIAAGDTYTCSFTATVSGPAFSSETDTVTATASDDDDNTTTGSDDATVTVLEAGPSIQVTKTPSPSSVDEPGGPVTFTVTVKNTSGPTDPVTITSLNDNVHGDLDGQGTCSVPQLITPGTTYTCTFTATVSGDAGDSETDTVTAAGQDDEQTGVSGEASATVTVTDVKPTIQVDKTATPTTVTTPGGPVTFAVSVKNTSPEPVTLTTLTDDVHGNLDGQGTCDVPQTIAAGDTYTCSFTATVSGPAFFSETDTVTATVSDDDDNTTTGSDDATVTVLEAGPSIQVTKTPSPSSVDEPGGPVTFTVTVKNTSGPTDPVTITSLNDNVHGDLDGQGTCSVPQLITPGTTYTCTFTATVSGDAGDSETDTVTAAGQDDEQTGVSGEASATVTVTDVKPTIQVDKTATPTTVTTPGGPVTFAVSVKNTSPEPVTLTTLTDDVHGNLDGQGTCDVPQTIAAGDTYTCSFTATVSGPAFSSETDTVTATASDDDDNTTTGSDDATVTVLEAGPSIQVTKTPSPSSVDEPGGPVTFTVTVKNTSGPTDPVTITSLNDNVHGDLDGQGTCSVPQLITPGTTYTCTFTATVSGDAGDSETDTVTAAGQDDEQTGVSGEASATVTVTDVKPTIQVDKTATPTTVTTPGGPVTFAVSVKNTSPEPVTLTTLTDDVHGNLDGQGTCDVPQTIAAGDTYTCSFTATVSGPAFSSETDTVTATASDDDDNTTTGSDDATVTVLEAGPSIQVTKTPSPSSVDEPGGPVTFTVTVKNTSGPTDPVTITSLNDNVHGDLDGQGTCSVPQLITPGTTYTCTFTATVSGDAGDSETDTVTAAGQDDEQTGVSGEASATVTIAEGRGPQIDVDKTANPTRGFFRFDRITYTIVVTNEGPDPVTLTYLRDDQYGNVNGRGDCRLPQVIQPGESYVCRFVGDVQGDPGDTFVDVVTAKAYDARSREATDSDDASVYLYWHGRTAAYWRTHLSNWPSFSIVNFKGRSVSVGPNTKVTDVFKVPSTLLHNGVLDLDNDGSADTLRKALAYSDGPQLAGGARTLLRQATAGLLNRARYTDGYPPFGYTTKDLLSGVNSALGTQLRSKYLAVASMLAGWNNGVA